MISIITCTANPARATIIKEHWTSLLGAEPFELLLIDDARSLSEGYNRGFAQSRGDVLIFAHDDIEILTADFVPRLRKHLETCDVVGVAGTTRLSNGCWVVAGPPYIFGQVAHVLPQCWYQVTLYGSATPQAVGGVQALDGLFMACKRAVLEAVPFDEQTFDSFHMYDTDFTFAAYLAGFRLAVCYDIPILHYSPGSYDEKWSYYNTLFMAKYRGKLSPLLVRKGWRWTAVEVETKAEVLEVMDCARAPGLEERLPTQRVTAPRHGGKRHMLSIITCTANPARASSIKAQWASLLGPEPFELLLIDDARSLTEGYNRGFAQSRGDVLIFAHDNVEILTADFVPRLRKHLESYDVVGVAGTTRLSNGCWAVAGPPYIFGKVANIITQSLYHVTFYGSPPSPAVGGIHALDGLFMACKREVVEAVQFDERTFDGFHLGDADFTFAAYLAGFRLAVCNDISILHDSPGSFDESSFDEKWSHYNTLFGAKYEGKLLPLRIRKGCQWAAVEVETKAEVLEVMGCVVPPG